MVIFKELSGDKRSEGYVEKNKRRLFLRDYGFDDFRGSVFYSSGDRIAWICCGKSRASGKWGELYGTFI